MKIDAEVFLRSALVPEGEAAVSFWRFWTKRIRGQITPAIDELLHEAPRLRGYFL